MCYLCYMSINIKIRSEIEELFSKMTFCISSNYPTSDPLCGQTNGAIFIKKILHSNFILYYNIFKAQLDSCMGRHSNPCLLFADVDVDVNAVDVNAVDVDRQLGVKP